MKYNHTTIEERIKIKETIASSQERMKSTKYLIDNFNHVKWHTIYDFWEAIKTAIDSHQCTLTQDYNEHAIGPLAHDKANRKNEETGVKFEVRSGLTCFIRHEPSEALFWGIDLAKADDAAQAKLNDLVKQHHIKYSTTRSYWWNYLFFENGDRLWLKEFLYDSTFNLIEPKFRNNTAQLFVNRVIDFVQQHQL